MIKNLIKKFIPSFLIDRYHLLLALLGASLYRFPSRSIKVIGVTGTNGKSTVVNLATKILETAGFKIASLSSIKFKIGKKEWPNTLRMTMPGRFQLQKFLREAVNSGCQYAILEVTSEGIKQYRHKFIDFNVAVFTNLAPEHIEAHGSFENYKRAKSKLFQETKGIHIINLDDDNAEYFLQFPAEEKYLYTTKKVKTKKLNTKLIKAEKHKPSPRGLRFSVDDTEFNLKLLGDFNVYNALAAICVGLSQGISLKTCRQALEEIKGIPGRMEEVISEPFKVIVDYAFTPNALEKVYKTIQEIRNKKQETKMICVLGSCGGGRDKWKRPILGKIAAKYCNEIIVTNEDPYDEDPLAIINQVAEGAHGKAQKILDRREAIQRALKLADPEDVVIITGKGSEPSICVAGGKRIPWDDREVVREEFKKL